jgi:hypothetical protein
MVVLVCCSILLGKLRTKEEKRKKENRDLIELDEIREEKTKEKSRRKKENGKEKKSDGSKRRIIKTQCLGTI